MKMEQFVHNLQDRLSSLLDEPDFASARQDRAAQSRGFLHDALIRHNMALSEEILGLDPSTAKGVVEDEKISAFRSRLASYVEKYGTGNNGYDRYIAIVTEYLALVAQEPLHPVEVRHLENNPPRDTPQIRYCSWKKRHLKDPLSLCRFCNCRPWP